MKLGINKKIIFTLLIIIIFTAGIGVSAQEGFVPLQEIPGVISTETAKNPSEFFNGVFKFGVIIAGFLAVIMIAYGGIRYMSTDAVSGKTEGKEIITAALMGLLLILFSYILLKTINPDILKFDLFKKNNDGGTSVVGTPPTAVDTLTLTPADKKLEADFKRWVEEQPDEDKRAKEFEEWKKEFPSITTSDKQKIVLFFKWKGY